MSSFDKFGAAPWLTIRDLASILKLSRKPVPLGPPAGEIVRVRTVDELIKAIVTAKMGATILLADGVYRVPPE